MGRETLKIVLSLLGAGAAAICALVLLLAILRSLGPHSAGALLWRFQMSAMVAMALFAGLAIVIYARLSRAWSERPTRRKPAQTYLRK